MNAKDVSSQSRRRLAALMFTDMVGSSRLFQKDEVAAKTTVDEMYRIIRDSVQRHLGQEVDTAGDGCFIRFASAIEAYECAYEIQARIYEYNLQQSEELRFQIRIGVHVGEYIEEDGRAIGDDVNIAARIERMADAGGIVLSQQAFDQISGKVEAKFEPVGWVPLKNISRKVHLHKATLPWLAPKGTLPFLSFKAPRRSRWFGLVMIAIVGAAACICLGQIVLNNIYVPPATTMIDLSKDWEIQISGKRSWMPYFSEQNWIYADKIHGAYRLRKQFQVDEKIGEPAIVLGYIPSQYRIYLNGVLVGGADRMSPVEYFAFDPSLLHAGEKNLIEIEAFTEGSTFPGLNIVSSIGAFVSDLPHAYAVIHRDRVVFQSREVVSIALSALLFLSCLLAWLLNPSNRVRAYQSAYLFGCLMFSMFPLYWLFSSEPYWLHVLFNLLPLSVCPVVLMSSYLAAAGKLQREFMNNVLFFILTTAILFGVVVFPPSPEELISGANAFYLFAVLYCVFTSGLILLSFRRGGFNASAVITIVFNMTMALIVLRSLSGHSGWPFGGSIYRLSDALFAFPVVFSMALALMGVWDHARKSKDARQRQRVLEINRKLLSILVKGTSFQDKLSRIQRITCRQIGIDKSTVYLVDPDSDKLVLRATSVIRNFEHEANLASEIIDPSPTGILGYVCQVRSPLLVEDLATDTRFAKYINSRKSDNFYTRSCMIFPLVAGNRLLAVITFSDKSHQERFNVADFKFASQAAHIAQILCQLEMPTPDAAHARLVS